MDRIPCPAKSVGKDPSDELHVAHVLRNHEARVGEVFLPESDTPALSILEPIFFEGEFAGITIDAKLIGGQQYEALYARIAEWEAATGAKVNIVSQKNHFELDKEFKADMDELITRIKNTPKAEGAERIYIHGEKEFEKEADRTANGIPLHPKVVDTLKKIGDDLKVTFPG